MKINLLDVLSKTDVLTESLEDVKEMHAECVEMFDMAWVALEEHNAEKAEVVIGKDDKIDKLEIDVREKVLFYLAGLPVGGNVPLSLVLIDTANNLERLADHITYMADSAIKYPCLDDGKFSDMLRKEKKLAYSMLLNVSNALDQCDEEIAQKVIGEYEELRKLYERFIDEADKSDLKSHHLVGLVLVARNLLRIGKKSKSIMELCLKPYPEAGK